MARWTPFSGQMRPRTRAKPRLAWRAASASTDTPFSIGGSRFGLLGHAACCAALTQWSHVPGRVGPRSSGRVPGRRQMQGDQGRHTGRRQIGGEIDAVQMHEIDGPAPQRRRDRLAVAPARRAAWRPRRERPAAPARGPGCRLSASRPAPRRSSGAPLRRGRGRAASGPARPRRPRPARPAPADRRR